MSRRGCCPAVFILCACGWLSSSALPATLTVRSMETVGRPILPDLESGMLRFVDDLGIRIDLWVPPGTARLVIQPGSDSIEPGGGWVTAYDEQGREIVRERESTGVALHLKGTATMLHLSLKRADGQVEVRIPAGAVRIRLVSQNYDHDCRAREDGRAVAYDASGRILADETGLCLDILAP